MDAADTDAVAQRAALVARLHDALEALERGDETALRAEIERLAEWRTRPLLRGLSRLARELGQALGELPPSDPGELDDACARLDHVVAMTEQASLRTLDLVEHSRDLVNGLRTAGLSADQSAVIDALRVDLSEMALAQSYQDLTGQIIRRVVGIVRRVHEGFNALGLPPRDAGDESARLSGPALAGLDRHAVSQDDADALLSGLGL